MVTGLAAGERGGRCRYRLGQHDNRQLRHGIVQVGGVDRQGISQGADTDSAFLFVRAQPTTPDAGNRDAEAKAPAHQVARLRTVTFIHGRWQKESCLVVTSDHWETGQCVAPLPR